MINPPNDLPKLGQPALRALSDAGYTTLAEIAAVRKADLLKLHGFGPSSIKILRVALAEQGLTFADEA